MRTWGSGHGMARQPTALCTRGETSYAGGCRMSAIYRGSVAEWDGARQCLTSNRARLTRAWNVGHSPGLGRSALGCPGAKPPWSKTGSAISVASHKIWELSLHFIPHMKHSSPVTSTAQARYASRPVRIPPEIAYLDGITGTRCHLSARPG